MCRVKNNSLKTVGEAKAVAELLVLSRSTKSLHHGVGSAQNSNKLGLPKRKGWF